MDNDVEEVRDVWLHSILPVAASAFGVAAGVFATKGAVRTQAALAKIDEKDRVVDAMAWIDRRVFKTSSIDPGEAFRRPTKSR